jgi:Tfp pilus assembly protein FimT
MRKWNGSRGVTLLELCFGIAVVAILATLAMPGLRSAARAAAVRSATFELAAAMQQTRASSIVQARIGVLCLSDALGNCLTGVESSEAWSAFLEVNGRPQPIAGQVLPAGVLLRATRARLNFWPDARAASTGTFTICDAQGLARPRALVLSQGGRVRQAAADARDCSA